MFKKLLLSVAVITVFSGLGVYTAHAQDADVGGTPPPGVAGVEVLSADSLQAAEQEAYSPDEPTHPPLKITPDKSEIVRLDQDAGTVIVGNPNHISVLAENVRTLVLVAKNPGATYFTVLGKNGDVIMQRHVVVAKPGENYVRVRKACASSDDDNCQATQVFYCPDMCHEIIMNTEAEKNEKTDLTKALEEQQAVGGAAQSATAAEDAGAGQ